MDDKLIDLEPHEWRSEREKPYEPFWGPGLPEAIAYAIGFIVMVTVVHLLT